jgi:exopolysaccharide biosynthesis protein
MRDALAHSAGRAGRRDVGFRRIAARLVLAATCAVSAWAVAAPIEVRTITINTPDGAAVGFLGTVDLRAAEVVVTGPLSKAEGFPAKATAAIEDTKTFAEREKTQLAVNANFFGWLGKKNNGEPAEVLGACISNGVVVSPARVHENKPDPAIAFFADPAGGVAAKVGRLSNDDLKGALAAVAGIGASGTTSLDGSLLVTDSKNTGDQARVDPDKRHPRTAIGASADGRTAYVVAIDGRSKTSVGVTLPELADYMISIGAANAINLDGGGSTAFIFAPEGESTLLTNKPSDGKFRPVAVNLGFRPRENKGPADEVSKPEAKPAGAGR